MSVIHGAKTIALVKWARQYPDREFSPVEAATDMGKLSSGQINAVNSMLYRIANYFPEYGIRRIAKGVYQYRTEWDTSSTPTVKKPSKKSGNLPALGTFMKVVGFTASRDTIVRDPSDNALYRVVPL